MLKNSLAQVKINWLIYMLIGTCACTEKSPFREGTEYQYDFEAAMSTGSTVSDDFSSATHLKGSLMILSKADGSNTRVNFKVRFRN